MKQRHVTKWILPAVAAALLISAPGALSHCQVPCGIYDDHARVHAMLEDTETVRKAMVQINELAGKDDAQSAQQLVRWVTNKEQHAQKIISTIADYFLTQRVKASQEDYAERLVNHHAVIVAAMKAKQHADADYAGKLKDAVNKLFDYYPAEEE